MNKKPKSIFHQIRTKQLFKLPVNAFKPFHMHCEVILIAYDAVLYALEASKYYCLSFENL